MGHINKYSLFYQKVWTYKNWGPIYNLKYSSSENKDVNSVSSNLKQSCSWLYFEARNEIRVKPFFLNEAKNKN